MSPTAATIEISAITSLFTSPPIAYFCAEFALQDTLPVYAGGLGVLAGDVLSQACDEKKPYVGIGMIYHKGFLSQQISKEANIYAEDPLDLGKADLSLLTDQGKPVIVTIPIHARTVQIKAWVKMVGCVPLLLLDTDVEGNEAQDITLCDRLYYGDREHRFKQEMVLGIGGYRMFARLGIAPRLYHLNEGHSSLLFFELAKECCQKTHDMQVSEALEHVTNVVFTNHTLVPAGNDVFSKDLVISYLSSYALEFPVDPSVMIKFGLIQDSSLFSPTMLALRLATVAQAVSQLHAKKAIETWPDHPMVAVTNGVRQGYWQSTEIAGAVSKADDALWEAHLVRKRMLIASIKETTGFSWNEQDLILGWARRLAGYKRPLLLFEDQARLRAILEQSPVPVRVLLSGKPHVSDAAAQEALTAMLAIVGEYGGSVVYMQNYTIERARMILSGIDVLLNTPVRGFEACGTSGMKASMNGVLMATTLDGWTDEVDWKDMGWVIPDDNPGTGLYDLLEKEIIPLYSQKEQWVARMRKTIEMATTRYSAARMLSELEEKVYRNIDSQKAAT